MTTKSTNRLFLFPSQLTHQTCVLSCVYPFNDGSWFGRIGLDFMRPSARLESTSGGPGSETLDFSPMGCMWTPISISSRSSPNEIPAPAVAEVFLLPFGKDFSLTYLHTSLQICISAACTDILNNICFLPRSEVPERSGSMTCCRDRFELAIVPDINKEGTFDEAVKGVDAIAHTALPYHFQADDPDGTLGILESARKCSSVKHVVVTSSIATVLHNSPTPQVFSELDWNDLAVEEVEKKGHTASNVHKYLASKTLAERSASCVPIII
ncbi:D-lactaldehyde dehydrogenase [Mycena venus]|uniref:D-lactaldehyde dehydrogenase n=1 Tax=Mycena venus TaxID=2733690 RepID=A0A8H6YFP6_9AGAR|nr:D-lactaldehyde dehydrogenase [Mycena venus]